MADPVRIEGYRDFTRIGAGGFATVYRAYQERFDRIVAVKVLNQSLDARALRRFERECQATGRLSGHPNVVTVLDSGLAEDGMAYMTTELMERGSLGDWMEQHGAMPLPDVLQIGVKMCGALTDVHEAGILHRDLKPQNILVSKYGEPALADFGISAVGFTDATGNTASFTPQHTPPEVLEGKTPAVTMDVYSLGSTLYHLLRGAPAFDMSDDEALLPFIMRVLNDEVTPLAPEVAPPEVSAVLNIAMAKMPADRYQSAEDFGRALQELQMTLGQPVTPMAATGPASPSGPGGPPPKLDTAALTIPSLLLPTFQPTLSPTISPTSVRSSTPAAGTKRTRVIVAAAIVVVVMLVGIGLALSLRGTNNVDAGGPTTTAASNSTPTSSPLLNPTPPVDGGRLVVALQSEISTNVTQMGITTAGLAVSSTVYEPLIRQRGDGLEPVLASEPLTPNADFTQWQIKVREGVTFHDGTALDAFAVQQALIKYQTSAAASTNLRSITAIDVVDDVTVRITVASPWAVLPAMLSQHPIFSPKANTTDVPAGTGPFAFQSTFTNKGVTVKRNSTYWGPKKPYLDEIEFRFFAQEQERITAFERGDVDVVFSANTTSIAGQQAKAAVIVQPDTFISYLVLQAKQTPTDDPMIREAVGLAIDREALVEAGNAGSRPTHAYLPEGSKWYPTVSGARERDVARAKQLVDAHKASHGGGDVTIAVTATVNSDVSRLFTPLRDQLAEAGITLTLNAKEPAQVTTDALAGGFQAIIASTPVPTDPDILNIYFHSQGDAKIGFNLGHFDDPEVDAALDIARSSPDEGVRKDAFGTVIRRENEIGAYQFLLSEPFALIASGRVTGLRGSLADNLYRGGSDPWCLNIGIVH